MTCDKNTKSCSTIINSYKICKTIVAVLENTSKLAQRNERARIEIEKLQAEMGHNGEKIQAETLNEEELDLDMQAGEGRRGGDASQCNGSCLESAFLQHFRDGSKAGKAAVCNPPR